jgi:predicted nucleotidyltransferase component of viral defense system
LFTTTAQRLGTTPQNAEKDFWVCWTPDALFNGRESGPRLLFKGGTSLSKGFGLIQRFSEDIDVTVFRDDLGQGYSVEEFRSFSRGKRDRALNEIRESCEVYINDDLFNQLIQSSPKRPRTERRNGRPTKARLCCDVRNDLRRCTEI